MRRMALALVLFASTAHAEDVVMGGIGTIRSTVGIFNTATTLVDLSRPANVSGNVSRATVRMFGGCNDGFKVKVVRPAASTLLVVAERGPFAVTSGRSLFDVTLTPGIAVQKGDLAAVTYLGNGGCVLPMFAAPSPHEVMLKFSGDPQAGATLTGGIFDFGHSVDVRLTSATEVVSAVIVAAGAAVGPGGALFKTDLQLLNNTFEAEVGKLVYHPAGQPASASDPSLNYNVAASSTLFLSNVVGTMGRAGVGSIDIVPTSGDMPLATVRIYNDAGAAGTAGFTEEVFGPELAPSSGDTLYFNAPANPVNFRMNVGIRTLGQGATLIISAQNQSPSIIKSYPPNYFEQVTLSQFVNGAPLGPNDFVTFIVGSGSAFIYTSTTDNRTNDSAIKFLFNPLNR